MNKKKLFLSICFVVFVSGTIFVMYQQSVMGIYEECLCMPEDLMSSGQYLCPEYSSFADLLIRDSYCIDGTCYVKYDIYCELWGGGTLNNPDFKRYSFTKEINDFGCCDWDDPWQ